MITKHSTQLCLTICCGVKHLVKNNNIIHTFKGNPDKETIAQYIFDKGYYKDMFIEDDVWRNFIIQYITKLIE